MVEKPPTCEGCPLHTTGRGFAPAVGNPGSLISFVGEALGKTEADQGEPFVGAAGVYLNRAFGMLGLKRADFRIGNVVHCQPPKDWLRGAPWQKPAIAHCLNNRVLNLYAYSPQVFVTLGVTATETVLSEVLKVDYKGDIRNWQGYVVGSGPYVVPTFHPAHLLRGQQHLMGAVLFAVRRAMEVASFGLTRGEVSLVVDPDPQWFLEWVATVPPDCWLAVDIETTTKGSDEEDVVSSGEIVRINFSMNPDQGVTIPWDSRYTPIVKRLLAQPTVKVFWNERFDVPILKANDIPISGVILDAMWAWKVNQSKMPRGLGFAAPFYSDLPPWKHLAQDAPGEYAALDALQTLRCIFGISKQLQKAGQWDTYLRHMVQLDAKVIHPMEEIGLKLDPVKLTDFNRDLEKRSQELTTLISQNVPEELLPLVGGWKTHQPGSFPKTITKLVSCCTDCGAEDVTLKHRCRKAK